MAEARPQAARWWTAAAVLAALAFVVFQAWTSGYGTTINDLPHIRAYEIDATHWAPALERDSVVAQDERLVEGIDKWMLRFKLYSVQADEVMNLMALARINPAQGRFDPHLYQYGGVWLYPLGLWYAALSNLSVVEPAPLSVLVSEPERMDRIYRFGRLFVVLAVAAAGFLLFLAAREVASPSVSLWSMVFFFVCPGTVYFSLTMKPHWYALVFVNLALLVVARAVARRQFSRWSELGIGVALGLAVGSATSFGPFAVLIWLLLAASAWQRLLPRGALVRVPAIALAVFVAANPYLLASSLNAAGEAGKAAEWFSPQFSLQALGEFAWNSLLPGFGVAWVILLLVVVVRAFIRPAAPNARLLILGTVAALTLAAVITASMSYWNVNYRYVSYALPVAIFLIAAARPAVPRWLLAVGLGLTLVQMLPLKLAFLDEDDPVHGTRLSAARWIDTNIPAGTGICLPTPTLAPFDSPPFNLTRYRVNAADCSFLVQVERYSSELVARDGFVLERQFSPRLAMAGFALTFGHVNPRISIYRRS